MTAETLISGFQIACLFAGPLAVGAFLALLAREFQMARLFALTLGAFLALLACCRIAELLAVGAFLALLAREFQMARRAIWFQMARLFALTLGAFLALLACCHIAELERAAAIAQIEAIVDIVDEQIERSEQFWRRASRPLPRQ